MPEAGFENLVLAVVRRETIPTTFGEISWFDQIGVWSPRLAVGCAVLIAACVATDLALNLFGMPTLTDGLGQISNDWLLASNAI